MIQTNPSTEVFNEIKTVCKNLIRASFTDYNKVIEKHNHIDSIILNVADNAYIPYDLLSANDKYKAMLEFSKEAFQYICDNGGSTLVINNSLKISGATTI